MLNFGHTVVMKKTTLKDIAEAAGVSVATVSMILSGKGKISEAVSTRVQNIASEMNYIKYSKEKSDKEWGEIEPSDTFQTPTYCGDYDATEQEFRFSYYDKHTKEWWFELTLESLRRITHGDLKFIDLYKPNNQSN